jgi:hypothetical protein
MQRLPLLCGSLVFSVLQFFLLLISASALHAQASPTASKPLDASVFAAYSLVSTDRKLNLGSPSATNSESTTNTGFTFGADISLTCTGKLSRNRLGISASWQLRQRKYLQRRRPPRTPFPILASLRRFPLGLRHHRVPAASQQPAK